ncbi:MAG: DUF58 domain-containing protein, partial [Planctomycetaceae bacterium]|nr:DUF58 domain-containing protein [Planctomycetaceae bacterium]
MIRPSFNLSAGALTQLLASVACFLGAFVLPLTFDEFQGLSQKVLIVLGCVTLTLGTAGVLFGQQLNRLLARAGKRSRVVIPREGVGYLAIMLTLAVGALMGHQNMPLLVFGMMAGPFILNGWIVYMMLKGVNVSRRAPGRATAGETVVVEIDVRNNKRFLSSHMLEVRDGVRGERLNRDRRDAEGTVTFVRVPARRTRTGRYQLQFAERGQYVLGPIRISSRFPLGIGERGHQELTTAEIIIRPRIGRLLPAWKRQQKELSEASQRVQARIGLFDDEFHRIRDYRSDDNPRMIHWRSSARRGQLMVREHHQNRQADSLVVLDLPEQPGWSDEAVETAVSLAATICADQTRSSSGSRFLLAVAARTSRFVTSRSPLGFRDEALDVLAVAEPSAKADLDDVLRGITAMFAMRDERIILITPRPNDAERILNDVGRQVSRDGVDLPGHTTIIPATIPEMQTVFVA